LFAENVIGKCQISNSRGTSPSPRPWGRNTPIRSFGVDESYCRNKTLFSLLTIISDYFRKILNNPASSNILFSVIPTNISFQTRVLTLGTQR